MKSLAVTQAARYNTVKRGLTGTSTVSEDKGILLILVFLFHLLSGDPDRVPAAAPG